jgi:hypothetical protein
MIIRGCRSTRDAANARLMEKASLSISAIAATIDSDKSCSMPAGSAAVVKISRSLQTPRNLQLSLYELRPRIMGEEHINR